MARALVIVDYQRDFTPPDGALAVPGGDAIAGHLNELSRSGEFDLVVATRDWHPPDHSSFVAAGGTWPVHCVQGTPGAELAADLDLPRAELVIRKGYHPDVDSYSAFAEADRRTPTGLAGYLRERGLGRVFLAGLATDFCVAWSALDARAAGFEAVVVEDACRGIDTHGSLAQAWRAMEQAGVQRINGAVLET